MREIAPPSLMVKLTLVSQPGHPMKTFAIFVGFAVVLIALAMLARLDWVEQCMADGNKRYECEERYDRAHPPAPQVNVHQH